VILNVEPGNVVPYVIGAEGTGGVNQNPGTTAADLTIGAGDIQPPAVMDTATGISASTTSAAVPLPPGIVAGDLLLLFVTMGTVTPTTPSGWTQLYNSAGVGTSVCYWKIASGSEGTSVTLVTGAAVVRYSVAHRIQGHDPAQAPVFNLANDAGSPSHYPNPPALTPSWGVKSTLWIALTHCSGTNLPKGQPSNFSDLVAILGMATARHQQNIATMNPGVFTLTDVSIWIGGTVAIAPLTPASIMVCKGGTFGATTPGGAAVACGTTPTGSGGIRIEPPMAAWNIASAASTHSQGGSSMFGQCPSRACAAGGAGGSVGQGFGSGGGGAHHQGAAASSGAAGAPGMILVEGYGLDA